MATTHQHNEILANKTILTLNLKQVARSRRRGQQGRGKLGARRRGTRRSQSKQYDKDSQQPQKYQPQIQNRIYYTYIPMADCPLSTPPLPLPPLRAFVKYLFFGLDRRIYLLACALQQDQVPLTNVRTSPGSMAARKGHSSKEIG